VFDKEINETKLQLEGANTYGTFAVDDVSIDLPGSHALQDLSAWNPSNRLRAGVRTPARYPILGGHGDVDKFALLCLSFRRLCLLQVLDFAGRIE